MSKITPLQIKKMNKLRASGLTLKQIAKKMEVSDGTVAYWTDNFKYARNKKKSWIIKRLF